MFLMQCYRNTRTQSCLSIVEVADSTCYPAGCVVQKQAFTQQRLQTTNQGVRPHMELPPGQEEWRCNVLLNYLKVKLTARSKSKVYLTSLL
eukprot:5381184-Amphidinium_carterae.2